MIYRQINLWLNFKLKFEGSTYKMKTIFLTIIQICCNQGEWVWSCVENYVKIGWLISEIQALEGFAEKKGNCSFWLAIS